MKSYINPIEKPINIITSLAHDGIKKNWPCANLAMSIMSNGSNGPIPFLPEVSSQMLISSRA